LLRTVGIVTTGADSGFVVNQNFAEGELLQGIQAKSFSPKQMPWEPSKIKDFEKLLEG
jgi:hypothetical protein